MVVKNIDVCTIKIYRRRAFISSANISIERRHWT